MVLHRNDFIPKQISWFWTSMIWLLSWNGIGNHFASQLLLSVTNEKWTQRLKSDVYLTLYPEIFHHDISWLSLIISMVVRWFCQLAITLKPLTSKVNDHLVTCNILLGSFGSWDSCGSYFHMNYWSGHYCRKDSHQDIGAYYPPPAILHSVIALWVLTKNWLLNSPDLSPIEHSWDVIFPLTE